MNSCAPASLAASITFSIGMAGLASAMFSRMVRLNSRFSCSTTPIWRAQPCRVRLRHVDLVDEQRPALGR